MSLLDDHRSPLDSLLVDDAVERAVGLPAGTLRIAQRWATQITVGLTRAMPYPVKICPLTLRARILAAPLTGVVPDNSPVPVNQGWVHADLSPDDHDLFWALHQRYGPDGAEVLAAQAQDCRVAVTPYRKPSLSPSRGDSWIGDFSYAEIRNRKVVDLSTMWAGPLTARWLAQLGAVVQRVEPSCRPDGARQTPRLFASLHPDKAALDLDLRRPADRRAFEDLLAECDLLLESFSPRVLTNLGYGPEDLTARYPGIQVISIRAFSPDHAEANWSGYGGGVHASSGLGMQDDQPRPAGFAYLDPLTALRALDLALTAMPGHHVAALSDTATALQAGGARPPAGRVPRGAAGGITRLTPYLHRCPFVVGPQ